VHTRIVEHISSHIKLLADEIEAATIVRGGHAEAALERARKASSLA